MAFGRVLKRGLFAAVLLGGGGMAAAYPDVVSGYYHELYPSDPAKRQALELCFLQDREFNRLDADARERCYRRALVPAAAAAGMVTPEPLLANAVDLQHAAGAGSMPRNDIRRAEEERAARHTSK
jgi:hypothetical protein